ncbi:hypothetical protein [Legionella fallonii]|uniref:Purine NTPase n=1 Tax=Legionella fallonii LLAP-10 TaxID=1212491 RepID=A0A098GAB8_9GAMM|nr:hypothetical protein [Legionella fallonii]CEG58430.1 conserved protein of unknown function [Legionella fallonii LLAP-10]
MLTKRERFARWRGTKADGEQGHINSALLISDYVRSVKHLDTIKMDFSSCESKTYKAFDAYEQRPFGVLLYCKLKIEEAIEQLPDAAKTERLLLTELGRIFEGIYDDPASNASQKFNNFVNTIKQLLAINPGSMADKPLLVSLYLDLYILLNVISLGISELNWLQKLAVSAVLDIESGMKEITLLRRMTEAKTKQLNKLMETPITCSFTATPDVNAHSTSNKISLKHRSLPQSSKVVSELKDNLPAVKKTIQDYFNQDFLRLINMKGAEEYVLSLLEEKINEVKEAINRLIIKRNKKEEIRLKIERIRALLHLIEENDKKESDKHSFIELINSHVDWFHVLVESSNKIKREKLVEKVMQLNVPDLYSGLSSPVLYGMGRITSLLSVVYRSYTPQTVQDTLDAKIPNAERDCKRQLKDLAQETLATLNHECSVIDKDIAKLNYQLSDERTELEELIAHETTANLVELAKANAAVKVALHEYRRISNFLLGVVWHFHVTRESSSILDQFIQEHDGFWVRLSNFLAQIFSFFKSDTATMIDQAYEMKKHLARFESEYQAEFVKEMATIENNPDIDQTLKINLRKKIAFEMRRKTNIIPYTTPNKDVVRYLTKSLEKLYEIGRGTELPEENEPVIDDSALLFLN